MTTNPSPSPENPKKGEEESDRIIKKWLETPKEERHGWTITIK